MCSTNPSLHAAESYLALRDRKFQASVPNIYSDLEVTLRVHRIDPKGSTHKGILASFLLVNQDQTHKLTSDTISFSRSW